MTVTLDERLLAMASFICAQTHVDIGSDHALLPRYLLESNRAAKVIAVEKNLEPYLRSKQALQGYPADIRLGDGLEPLQQDEGDSLSIGGLGAQIMIKILSKSPDKLPRKLVLQANDEPQRLRQWALESGFHLKHERLVRGFSLYTVLCFEKDTRPDPVYQNLPQDLAIMFGPQLLQRADPRLREDLKRQKQHFQKLYVKHQHGALQHKLERVERAIRFVKSH